MSDVELPVLELLANGPTSFAALYGFLVRQGVVNHDVGSAFDSIVELSARDMVTIRRQGTGEEWNTTTPTSLDRARAEYIAWLEKLEQSELSVDALSLDDVGLWLSPGPHGAPVIDRLRHSARTEDLWELDFDGHKVVVRAASQSIASKELVAWLNANPECLVERPFKKTRNLADFTLRNGRVLENGVELVAKAARPDDR